MTQLLRVFVVSLFAVGLFACGGGGGGSSGGVGSNFVNSPATATAGNSGDLAANAAEGAKQSVKTSSAPLLRSTAGGDQSAWQQVDSTLKSILQPIVGANLQRIGLQQQPPGPCGGNYTVNGGQTGGSIVFNNYCVTQGSVSVVMNGGVTYLVGGNSFTATYNNLSVTTGGQTSTINGSVSCSTSLTNCTYSVTSTGANGQAYQTGSIQVTGNNSSGYSISATISDTTHGRISISASNLTICSTGRIGAGTILVTDSTNTVVISVTFPNCDTMVVTYQGVATTYSQSTYMPI